MSYSAEERETVIVADDGTKKWKVYTLQSTVITKLRKAGEEAVKIDEDGAHHFELDWHQISFRKKEKRQVSDEQRARMSERAKKMRKQK